MQNYKMKKLFLSSLILLSACNNSNIDLDLNQNINISSSDKNTDELRKLYIQPSHLWPKPYLSEGVEHREIGNLPTIRYASQNPYTQDKYNLGRLLFSETKLSGSGNMSCLSCHNPQKAWADGLRSPMGIDGTPLKRNSPSVVNTAFHNLIFWDGRTDSLEKQAEQVLLNPHEMNSSEEIIKNNLKDSLLYKSLFKKAFGDENITLEKVGKSLAIFQRAIITKNKSKFDQFVLGNSQALSDSQVRGLHLFRTKARCMTCHNGPNFTDDKRHNIGLVMEGSKYEDKGFYNITKKESDFGLFRTPTLRNITKTAPYFHNGLVLNLNGVLNMYSQGMPNSKNKSKLLVPVGLELSEREDIKNFLESLSEDVNDSILRN